MLPKHFSLVSNWRVCRVTAMAANRKAILWKIQKQCEQNKMSWKRTEPFEGSFAEKVMIHTVAHNIMYQPGNFLPVSYLPSWTKNIRSLSKSSMYRTGSSSEKSNLVALHEQVPSTSLNQNTISIPRSNVPEGRTTTPGILDSKWTLAN